jgi:squalene-hopene/tetraprenyl-beta-curcumene cyclase
MVVTALRGITGSGGLDAKESVGRGVAWLLSAQNADGGWGGVRGAPSSIEETSLALRALAGTEHIAAIDRAAEWLVARVESGEWRHAAPIGFYFAKLWYSERLYPLIWTVAALGSVGGSGGRQE